MLERTRLGDITRLTEEELAEWATRVDLELAEARGLELPALVRKLQAAVQTGSPLAAKRRGQGRWISARLRLLLSTQTTLARLAKKVAGWRKGRAVKMGGSVAKLVKQVEVNLMDISSLVQIRELTADKTVDGLCKQVAVEGKGTGVSKG